MLSAFEHTLKQHVVSYQNDGFALNRASKYSCWIIWKVLQCSRYYWSVYTSVLNRTAHILPRITLIFLQIHRLCEASPLKIPGRKDKIQWGQIKIFSMLSQFFGLFGSRTLQFICWLDVPFVTQPVLGLFFCTWKPAICCCYFLVYDKLEANNTSS